MSETLIESEIAEYYTDKNVFITGATGFLGKVLIEKLLRSCPNVKSLYVLVRAKRGKLPHERLDEIFNCELFHSIRSTMPKFADKVVPILGDMIETNLGLSKEHEELLIKNVHIVIHSAATVRFDEPLKLAYEMNVNGVRKMLDLAKKMINLESFVHVSTAYANCDRKFVGEIVYGSKIKADLLRESLEWMDNQLIDDLTPSIIKQMPNTYTFTKQIAENLVFEHENTLPISIVRPSIVIAAAEEPLPGWIDNANGPTGIVLASGKGLLRTMIGNRDAIADLIPVDLCCNLIIATAWFRGAKKTNRCLVFNCTSGQLNSINWGTFEILCYKALMKYPFDNPLLVPKPIFTQSKVLTFVIGLFEQKILAHVVDFALKLTKKKPFLVKVNKKVDKAVDIIKFFTTHQWEFSNENVLMLLSKLNTHDLKLFNFNVKNLNWTWFIEKYCLGAKRFILKEDMSKLDRAHKSYKLINRVTFTVKCVLVLLTLKLIFLRRISIKHIFMFLFKFVASIAAHLRSTLV